MLTQKMQETITRFKKNRKAATLTQEEALQKSRSNLLKPLVETLILSRLCRGDSYGYEIARSVEQGSGGQLRIPHALPDDGAGVHYGGSEGCRGEAAARLLSDYARRACAPQRAHGCLCGNQCGL